MASVSRKYKEAQERWIQHCHDIERSTAKIPKGTEQERKDRIARARKDYRYFVRTYFPHLATTECADFQVDAAVYMRDHENARGLFEWARGHAKSTHISLLQPLWLKIQPNAQPLIMILVSKSQEAARRLLGDLQAELESNDLYNADFGNQRGAGIWTNGEFTTATGDLFIALGRGQSPRGIKKRGLRPNYIAVDDIDDDELVRNPRRVGEAVDWLMTALLGTMAMGRGRLAVVGNRIGRTSVIGTLADNPHFHHTVVNALDRKGLPSWPQNYTLQEIAEMRGIMGERRFQREYMNNPVNAGTVFEEKHIRFGKMLRMREYRAIVCYTDPSFKASATADFKATMLVGITPQGKYHVLKAYADQTKVSTMVEWHYDAHDYVGTKWRRDSCRTCSSTSSASTARRSATRYPSSETRARSRTNSHASKPCSPCSSAGTSSSTSWSGIRRECGSSSSSSSASRKAANFTTTPRMRWRGRYGN